MHEPPACAVATITVAPLLRKRAASASERRGQRRNRQAPRVGRHCRGQRFGCEQADDADADAGDVDDDRGLDVGPGDWPAGGLVDEIRGKERKPCLGRACLERAPWVLVRSLRRASRSDWTEVELVITDRRRGVADDVVSRDDRRAFVEVRLERPLKEIATVEEDDAAVVRRPRRPQVRDISRKKRESAASLVREDSAVQVGGADDRQRHAAG